MFGFSNDKKKQKELEKQKKDKERVMYSKGYKQILEYECTCTRCNKVFYYNSDEYLKNLSDKLLASGLSDLSLGLLKPKAAAAGSLIDAKVKDFDKCPNCGSKALRKEEKTFWVDKNGNMIE